jgi:hypothetical protein
MVPGRMIPRSKWNGIKYHWFTNKLKPNSIDIIKIGSADQRADFLTKSLRREKFEANRNLTSDGKDISLTIEKECRDVGTSEYHFSGPRGKSIFPASFHELTDKTRERRICGC